MNPTFENRFYELYLEYFHKAEANRRWNLQQDIPWEAISRSPDPAIVSVVEAFMAVELYLPDYTSKILHLIRASRGRAWFQANWGYEESKHSLALEMWLTKSGSRTDNQIREFEELVLGREWNLPYHTPLEMMIYTTLQEFATALNYRGLRKVGQNSDDPALSKLLALLARDEVGHFQFFKDGVRLYMAQDRDRVVEALNFVIHSFRMPASDIVPDWEKNGKIIGRLGIFDDRIYLRDVVRPVLQALGVSVEELREARKRLNAIPRSARLAEPAMMGGKL
jgi:acyl-[acyl-carrier-protein] desaturase